MEVDLRSLIADGAGISGLLSTRIYWSSILQAAADPNLVLYKITGGPGLHMQGSDGLESALVQMNIRALTYASMIEVRDSLVSLLHGYRGIKGSTEFQQIELQSERQNSEKPGTTLYFTDQLDFNIWSRATP